MISDRLLDQVCGVEMVFVHQPRRQKLTSSQIQTLLILRCALGVMN